MTNGYGAHMGIGSCSTTSEYTLGKAPVAGIDKELGSELNRLGRRRMCYSAPSRSHDFSRFYLGWKKVSIALDDLDLEH